MSFEPFAPIDLPFKERKGEDKGESEIARLRRELELLREENRNLKGELERLKFAQNSERLRFEEEKRHLLSQIEALKGENRNLQSAVQNLQGELEHLLRQREELQNLLSRLSEEVIRKLDRQREETLDLLLQLVVGVVKELLRRDEVWDRETLEGIFKEIFSEKLFRGEITVKANPEDAEVLRELLSQKEGVVFDIVPDPNLGRSELEVETENFFVERKLDQLADEIASHLLKGLIKRDKTPQREETEEQTSQ